MGVKWLMDIWEEWPTTRMAKIAFIMIHEQGDEIPKELMDSIIEELKKDSDFYNAGLPDSKIRKIQLRKAIENRPQGTTKTEVYDKIGDEWGVDSESVKRKYSRDNKGT